MRALVQKLSAAQEAALITAIFAGWFIFSAASVVMAGFPAAGGYDDASALSLVLFECAAFAVAALVLRWRGWKRSDFTFQVSWSHAFVGLLLLATTYVVDLALWEMIGHRLDDGSVLEEMSTATQVSFGAALLLSVVNGAFEEFFLCRYLIERFQNSGAAFAIALSACIRMCYHVYQGPWGALSVLAFGLIVGVFYWRTRALGAVVIAHILADLIWLS